MLSGAAMKLLGGQGWPSATRGRPRRIPGESELATITLAAGGCADSAAGSGAAGVGSGAGAGVAAGEGWALAALLGIFAVVPDGGQGSPPATRGSPWRSACVGAVAAAAGTAITSATCGAIVFSASTGGHGSPPGIRGRPRLRFLDAGLMVTAPCVLPARKSLGEPP